MLLYHPLNIFGNAPVSPPPPPPAKLVMPLVSPLPFLRRISDVPGSPQPPPPGLEMPLQQHLLSLQLPCLTTHPSRVGYAPVRHTNMKSSTLDVHHCVTITPPLPPPPSPPESTKGGGDGVGTLEITGSCLHTAEGDSIWMIRMLPHMDMDICRHSKPLLVTQFTLLAVYKYIYKQLEH